MTIKTLHGNRLRVISKAHTSGRGRKGQVSFASSSCQNVLCFEVV